MRIRTFALARLSSNSLSHVSNAGVRLMSGICSLYATQTSACQAVLFRPVGSPQTRVPPSAPAATARALVGGLHRLLPGRFQTPPSGKRRPASNAALTGISPARSPAAHVIGMYAPSFFTGTLIMRFGVRTVMATGLLLIAGAASIGLLGLALWNFWLALALLGVGWNLSFIGATTLITECHGPRERNKVQAFNDFLVFGSMAFGSFLSGLLLTRYGWGAVNQVVFAVLITAGLLLAWGSLVRRPDPV
jgi:hypothetical protein